MDYIEVSFSIVPEIPGKDILTAQLAEIGFESFMEEKRLLKAYIPEKNFDETMLQQISLFNDAGYQINYTVTVIKDENWNRRWESNFQPIKVDDFCTVQAPFHTSPITTPYAVIINPQMSFGTGHHATTFMMIQAMRTIDFSGKSVLDMGCGTGVLAILSAKLGAGNIWAVDNDRWAYENTLENIQLNRINNIHTVLGDASALPNTASFDIVLANINRNILLQDLPAYRQSLHTNGLLLMSGFLTDDAPLITQNAEKSGFRKLKHLTKEEWSLLVFEKLP